MQQNSIDHDELEMALGRVSALMGGSETHGVLCGMICAQGKIDEQAWMGQVIEHEDVSEPALRSCELMRILHQQTIRQMNDTNLSFTLLLPDDDQPLLQRVEGLGDWCQGFLFGLGMGGLGEADILDDEAKEFLEDMTEITRVELPDADEASEEGNASFEEVVEYIRMGVLMLYEELQPRQSQGVKHLH